MLSIIDDLPGCLDSERSLHFTFYILRIFAFGKATRLAAATLKVNATDTSAMWFPLSYPAVPHPRGNAMRIAGFECFGESPL